MGRLWGEDHDRGCGESSCALAFQIHQSQSSSAFVLSSSLNILSIIRSLRLNPAILPKPLSPNPLIQDVIQAGVSILTASPSKCPFRQKSWAHCPALNVCLRLSLPTPPQTKPPSINAIDNRRPPKSLCRLRCRHHLPRRTHCCSRQSSRRFRTQDGGDRRNTLDRR